MQRLAPLLFYHQGYKPSIRLLVPFAAGIFNVIMDAQRPDFLASVLERQHHSRAVRLHFAVLNLHVQLHNLGNAQITQRIGSGLYRILCRIVPGLRARADYLHYLID